MATHNAAPSRVAVHAIRGLLLTTSCSVAILAEERRRRLKIVRAAAENARKIHAAKASRGAPAADGLAAWEAALLRRSEEAQGLTNESPSPRLIQIPKRTTLRRDAAARRKQDAEAKVEPTAAPSTSAQTTQASSRPHLATRRSIPTAPPPISIPNLPPRPQEPSVSAQSVTDDTKPPAPTAESIREERDAARKRRLEERLQRLVAAGDPLAAWDLSSRSPTPKRPTMSTSNLQNTAETVRSSDALPASQKHTPLAAEAIAQLRPTATTDQKLESQVSINSPHMDAAEQRDHPDIAQAEDVQPLQTINVEVVSLPPAGISGTTEVMAKKSRLQTKPKDDSLSAPAHLLRPGKKAARKVIHMESIPVPSSKGSDTLSSLSSARDDAVAPDNAKRAILEAVTRTESLKPTPELSGEAAASTDGEIMTSQGIHRDIPTESQSDLRERPMSAEMFEQGLTNKSSWTDAFRSVQPVIKAKGGSRRPGHTVTKSAHDIAEPRILPAPRRATTSGGARLKADLDDAFLEQLTSAMTKMRISDDVPKRKTARRSKTSSSSLGQVNQRTDFSDPAFVQARAQQFIDIEISQPGSTGYEPPDKHLTRGRQLLMRLLKNLETEGNLETLPVIASVAEKLLLMGLPPTSKRWKELINAASAVLRHTVKQRPAQLEAVMAGLVPIGLETTQHGDVLGLMPAFGKWVLENEDADALGRVLQGLSRGDGWLDSSMVIALFESAWRDDSRAHQLLRLLETAERTYETGVSPNTKLFLRLRAPSSANILTDSPTDLLGLDETSAPKISESLLDELAMEYAAEGRWDMALEIMGKISVSLRSRMDSRRAQPADVFSQRRLAHLFLRSHGPDDSEAFIRELDSYLPLVMRREWVEPIMEHHSVTSNTRGFLDWLRFCSERGFAPTKAFYEKLAQVLGKYWRVEGKNEKWYWSQVEKAEVERSLVHKPSFSRLPPPPPPPPAAAEDQQCFSRMTKASEKRDWQRVLTTYDKHRSEPAVTSSDRCLDLAITACLKQDGPSSATAHRLLREAVQAGLDISDAVRRLLVATARDANNPEQAVKVALERGLEGPLEFYNTLVRSILQRGSPEAARAGVALCERAAVQHGNGQAAFGAENFANLVGAYVMIGSKEAYAGLEVLLQEFTSTRRWWHASKLCKESLKLAIKKCHSLATSDHINARWHRAAIVSLEKASEHTRRCREELGDPGDLVRQVVAMFLQRRASEVPKATPVIKVRRRRAVSQPVNRVPSFLTQKHGPSDGKTSLRQKRRQSMHKVLYSRRLDPGLNDQPVTVKLDTDYAETGADGPTEATPVTVEERTTGAAAG